MYLINIDFQQLHARLFQSGECNEDPATVNKWLKAIGFAHVSENQWLADAARKNALSETEILSNRRVTIKSAVRQDAPLSVQSDPLFLS